MGERLQKIQGAYPTGDIYEGLLLLHAFKTLWKMPQNEPYGLIKLDRMMAVSQYSND